MKNLIRGIGLVLAFIFMMVYFFGGGVEKYTENEMNKIELQVANDAIKQYEIAKRSGSAMDAYVHAGLVSAAFLQAKDEANYKKWKKIEEQEANKVGL